MTDDKPEPPKRWRVKDEQGEDLIAFWRTFPAPSNEVAAADIIDELERELADAKADCLRLHREKMDALYGPDGFSRVMPSAERRIYYANPQQVPDRSDAVNLARNWLDSQGPNSGMHITTKGIRSLAEAVMLMDAWILEVTQSHVASVPICGAHAQTWFCERDHLQGGMDATCVVCAHQFPSATASGATPWDKCQFAIVAWEIDQGQIGVSVKHEKGGSAWMVEPHEHVKALLRDGLRYRWLRGGTTDYTPICEQALCLEAMDEWIDAQIAATESGMQQK